MTVSGSRRSKGFTLIELLVVLLIIGLVSAATLPTILPALAHRQVSESARILQASIEGARDAAIRANAPRGIRLLPDPAFPGTTAIPMLASNRIVPIEPAPDYSEGKVSVFPFVAHPTDARAEYPGTTGTAYPAGALRIEESRFDGLGLPNARTSWYWNIRVGDRIQIGDTGRFYTVVGPMRISPFSTVTALQGNPELFVNIGEPGTGSPITRTYVPGDFDVEFLYLVNGQDDNANGYTDEGWDGVNNNGANGTDEIGEWEQEVWIGPEAAGVLNQPYTIKRRPVPTQGARVIEMPANVVIDMTTWDSTQERSRLPVDLNTHTVDVMVSPNGTVIPTTAYSTPTSAGTLPFFHFWLAERTDVLEPAATGSPRLPMPDGVIAGAATALKGDRRLVTLFTRSGLVVTNEVESFNATDVNQPYYDAQLGTREAR